MVKRYTRKNRNLKGGGCKWKVSGDGGWYAEPDGVKVGTAMMMNAIIGILGQETFKELYDNFGGRRTASGPPTEVASSDNFLDSISGAIVEKIRRKVADGDEMAVEQLLEAMNETVGERSEDLSGAHGDRAKLERRLQLLFSSAAGKEVAGGSESRKTLNDAVKQLKNNKSRKGVPLDLKKIGQNAIVADEIQRQRAVMEMSNCDTYVKNLGRCNMYGRALSCPAQGGRDGGFHDKQLKDKWRKFGGLLDWKSLRGKAGTKKKNKFRAQMEADLTDGERVHANAILEAIHSTAKITPDIWYAAKKGCSVEDRLSRRGWRGNSVEANAIRNELYPSREQNAVAVVGNGSGSSGDVAEGELMPGITYRIVQAGDKYKIIIKGTKEAISDFQRQQEEKLQTDAHTGMAQPKGTGIIAKQATYLIPDKFIDSGVELGVVEHFHDSGNWDVFLNYIRTKLMPGGKKKVRQYIKNLKKMQKKGGKRKRKTRKRIKRRTRKRKRKRKTKKR